jgi:hypothetical protein
VHVANSLANLEESLILLYCLLVFSKVVKEDSCGIIGAALISGFACSLASEGEDVIVLESFLCSDSIVRICVCHVEP